VIATADGGTARGAVWAPDASLADPTTVAIVTRPNNPNGELRTTAAEYDDRAIYDMAYLWPHFTAEYDQRLNHSLMIFTASKMAGIAGTFARHIAVHTALVWVVVSFPRAVPS